MRTEARAVKAVRDIMSRRERPVVEEVAKIDDNHEQVIHRLKKISQELTTVEEIERIFGECFKSCPMPAWIKFHDDSTGEISMIGTNSTFDLFFSNRTTENIHKDHIKNDLYAVKTGKPILVEEEGFHRGELVKTKCYKWAYDIPALGGSAVYGLCIGWSMEDGSVDPFNPFYQGEE